jgi:hypothetical protein
MADCKNLAGCPFFNDKMSEKPALASMMKKRYCLGESTLCARYIVCEALGKENVPGNLFPNMQDKAQVLIGAK